MDTVNQAKQVQGNYGVGIIAGQLNGSSPRELGIAERISGLVAGLSDLNQRLDAIAGKIMGGPIGGSNAMCNAVPLPPASLQGRMSEAEAYLRSALASADTINMGI